MIRPLLILLLLALPACRDETAAIPQPLEMTAQTVGHFCQMNVLEHPGPKGQIHLEGLPG
ncbi:MAG: nitrous oxide reductase accessory protein NosL, partial [Cypionkella sp.]|nr:nitrous oxide reductase accessory protein NosL [Cypionkella sp.]